MAGTEQAQALIDFISQYAWEHRFPMKLPEGLILDLHPSTWNAVRQVVYQDVRYSAQAEPAPFPPQIPVRINPLLERDTWRLITEKINNINGGRLA